MCSLVVISLCAPGVCVQSCVCIEDVVVPVFTTTAVVRMEVSVCVLCKYSLPRSHQVLCEEGLSHVSKYRLVLY